MSVLTLGLLVFALIMLTYNIIIDIDHQDFNKPGYFSSCKSGFTPMSNEFNGDSPGFQPEGYGELGTYIGMNTVPSVTRSINIGGLTYPELKKKYPGYDYDFIT